MKKKDSEMEIMGKDVEELREKLVQRDDMIKQFWEEFQGVWATID